MYSGEIENPPETELRLTCQIVYCAQTGNPFQSFNGKKPFKYVTLQVLNFILIN